MAGTPKDTIKQIEYYAAALKAPRIRDSAARLADLSGSNSRPAVRLQLCGLAVFKHRLVTTPQPTSLRRMGGPHLVAPPRHNS